MRERRNKKKVIHARRKIKDRSGRKLFEKERRKKNLFFFYPRKARQDVYKVQLSKRKC